MGKFVVVFCRFFILNCCRTLGGRGFDVVVVEDDVDDDMFLIRFLYV